MPEGVGVEENEKYSQQGMSYLIGTIIMVI